MGLQAHYLFDTAKPYQRLLSMLAARARSRGSRDPEAAAQEAVKRSLQHPQSRPAIEYYFSGELAQDATPPEWSLDQVFAWLHAVLHYVVREECNRVGFHREVP